MKKVRILHLVSSLSIGSGVMGMIMNIYRNINKEKVQFDFIYFIDSEKCYKDEILELGGSCFKIPKPSLNKTFIKEINKLFKSNSSKYIALHNHELYLNFIFSPIAKINGINNIITHSHTTMYSDKRISAIRNKILCIPIKYQSDYYFACSKAAGKFIYGQKNIDRNKVIVVNNAIDCRKFKYSHERRYMIRNKLGLNDKLIVGHIGRFNAQKNHTFLIDVFYQIFNTNKNAHLVLVGTGPLEDKIRDKVRKLQIEENVTFLGQRKDINDIMSSIDVLVMPSLYEGLPVVGIEAQASGLPCIMSDEITDEVNICNVRFLNLNESSNVWANEIIRYLKDFKREDTSEIIKMRGYDIELECKKLELFYLSL